VVPAIELGPVVAELVSAVAGRPPVTLVPNPVEDTLLTLETAMAELDDLTSDELPGHAAGLGCPSCHGALFELPGQPTPRYRCRVGHAWSPESLLDEQAEAFEGALWMALRSLEDKSALARRMAEAAKLRGGTGLAERYLFTGEEADRAGQLIRELIARWAAARQVPADGDSTSAR
jgi:two-component system chemotaxis response regulator CheB